MSETPAPATPEAPAVDEGLTRDVLAVAGVVVLGAIMSILDVTVVNVAIKTLSQEFSSPLSTIQWVATGYTLALATVIPLSAWTAERFGTKRVYMTSIALFAVGSVLSGLAQNDWQLILFRVLQGFGGGLIMPIGMMILTRKAGPQRLGRVMAVIGIPMLLGPVLGPILGGWLVDAVSWRWIFFINVPIAAAAIVSAIRVLPADTPSPEHRLDWLGVLLLSPGLAAIIYGLAESATEGGFGHAKVLVPIVAGVVVFGLFIAHALTAEEPLVNLRLYKNRVFAASNITLALLIVSVFGGMLLAPLYLQTVRGETALSTGLLLAPQGLGAMIAMPIAGTLADRTGIGRIVPFGLLAVLASFIGLTQLAADTSYWAFGGLLFVMGLGMGFSMMPTFSGAMQTLKHADIPSASTTLNIVQQVSASFGTAVLSVILTRQIVSQFATVPGASGSANIGDTASLPENVRKVIDPLLANAFGNTFIWAVAFVAIAIVVAAILLPRSKPEPLDAEAQAEVNAAMMG
ncbi:DHA2 family efflux MFS transporter permease subunit [Spongisporangium articulatum]|uniref:DHA2 family efflux MFS transporter permease subunit n=1 Tax=Spongisporangium articulatum TaxID=3362603 RepID=A0ABW8AMD3_9ACTN